MSFDVEEVLAEHRPASATARVCFREDLLARHMHLENAHTDALKTDEERNSDPQAPRIEAELAELETEIEAALREFRFEAASRRAWLDLLAQHPPTEDDQRAGRDHHPETFQVAAVALCAADPHMTVEQAERLQGCLSLGEWDALWQACRIANLGVVSSAPKSLAGTALRRMRNGSSTTAPPEESPAPSS